MDSILSDLRQSARLLLKSPGFTIVAVSALALGIGANTALFSVVNTVLLNPLPYPQPDRLVAVTRTYKTGFGTSTSIPKFMAWKRAEAFEGLAAYDFEGPGLNLNGGDRPEQVKGIHVSQDFFKVFGVSPVIGRSFTDAEDRPGGQHVAVLTNEMWKSHFNGDLHLIGRSITLNSEPYIVVGVMPPGFVSDPVTDIFIPLQADPNSANQGHYLRATARLKPGVSIATANAQLKVIAAQFRKDRAKAMSDDETAGAMPLQELTVSGIRSALFILLGAVGFVLLIACANVANLLLARASSRQKEIAIRSAMGATRSRIVRQLLTESVLLAATGGFLGFLAGLAGVRALLAFSPGDIPRVTAAGGVAATLALDWRVFAFAVAVSLLTGVAFGVLPALQISRVDLNTTLKESSGRSGSGLKQNRTRGILVILEVAMAVVLLACAGLLIQTFGQLRNVKPGIQTHNVLTMRTSLAGGKYAKTDSVAAFVTQALQRMETLPGVQAAATTLLPPMEGSIDMSFNIEGKAAPKPGEPNGDEDIVYTTPHYFGAFEIPLLRGRVLQPGDTAKSAPVMVISQAFAKKYFDKEDPIGRQITIGKGAGPDMSDVTRQIVGVVGDVRQSGLDQPLAPIMYLPASQMRDGLNQLASATLPLTWIVRTSTDPWALNVPLQREILAVDGQMPVSKVLSMEQLIGTTIARQNFNMLLLTVFASIALLLASIGIYGLMAYSVEQRQQEIGIRAALGASKLDTLRLVLGQGMRLTLIGIVLGLAGAFASTRLLSAMLYGVKPTDPLTFAAVAVLLTSVSLLACYIPARRASAVDPVVALRVQ